MVEMTPHLNSLWIILFFISRLLIQVGGGGFQTIY